MDAKNEITNVTPPNILSAFRGGFDAIANHVSIIMLPVLLDLWLWLGPHLQIKTVMAGFLESLTAGSESTVTSSGGLIQVNTDVIVQAIDRINLMTFLRSYPIGIPSLVSGILPIEVPAGSPLFVEISSPVGLILLWLGLTLFGALIGSFYFLLISQAAINGQVRWKMAWKQLPRMALQALILMVAMVLLLLVLLVPVSCMLSVISMSGIPVSQIAVIILSGMLLWVSFPLVFTPLGIFALRINLLAAVQRSIVLTRMTLPNTVLFFVILFITGQGLDFLWRVPDENSWFTLIGLAGHGFVASSLLAAAFIYYRDANAWAQKIYQGIRQSQSS